MLCLITVCAAWELRLAPLRPGGSWLALKALPLLLPLPGLLKGRRYTYQWTGMLVLAYFTEGVMRAWGDKGLSQWLALAELTLALVVFTTSAMFARQTRDSQPRGST
ncbi:DUF2069 domain-containing protein [Parachitinimonas caeni]|uniref:DUF2069 domain-containing protein n=1 Tax=Parachitinimonas caeni TaxID=3031301 RepID=A0ABT7DT46_9NEIS|nr:DUF2069 domain-containing protein [Parachitinimonas caeni]